MRYATRSQRKLPADRAPYPRAHKQTRIRIVDTHGDTIGIVWTAPDADADHIRTLIPDGYHAMVARNIWPDGN